MHDQPSAAKAPETATANPPQGGSPPSPKDNRDENGRFKAGNRGGPGNPFARQTAALRKALVNTVTEKGIADIAAVLLDKARQGDTAACKLIFSYVVGKPAPAADADTLDQDELKTMNGNHVDPQQVMGLATAMPLDMVLNLLHVLQPILQQAKAKEFFDIWQEASEREEERKAGQAAEEMEEDFGEDDDELPACSPINPEAEQRARRAWEAEDAALRAKFMPARPEAEPAPKGASDQGRQQTGIAGQRRAKPPAQEPSTDTGAGVPLQNRRQPRVCQPSRNGCNGAAAGSAPDGPADNKR
jgi:hypothetical protein